MARGFVHTVYKSGQWINEFEDGAELGLGHRTKEDAIAAGSKRAASDRTKHVIHHQDGTISEHSSDGIPAPSPPG